MIYNEEEQESVCNHADHAHVVGGLYASGAGSGHIWLVRETRRVRDEFVHTGLAVCSLRIRQPGDRVGNIHGVVVAAPVELTLVVAPSFDGVTEKWVARCCEEVVS